MNEEFFVQCDGCGKVITDAPDLTGSARQYCSSKCREEETRPAFTITCNDCGEVFVLKPVNIGSGAPDSSVKKTGIEIAGRGGVWIACCVCENRLRSDT